MSLTYEERRQTILSQLDLEGKCRCIFWLSGSL